MLLSYYRRSRARAKAKGKGQRAKGKGQRAKGKGQRAKGKGQRAKGKGQRAKGKGQRAKGKGQRAKGKGQRAKGAGSRTTSSVGGTRIGNDGMITCANKSERETGKPASAQNGPAMAGIPSRLGNSLKIGPHQQRNLFATISIKVPGPAELS
ncbi:hypothetical protein B0H19DRAFT_1082371 [Mycena capillaripes]|nr:hypothetical protein B0H19DRAFT_1082371 [Mycena capillaripes]